MLNKLKRLPVPFKEVLKIASKEAASLGFKIYLVGGVARDLILGKTIFDLDIVVEGDAALLALKLSKHFGASFRKHHAFGTAVVTLNKHKIDFATSRNEHYPHWGALPKVNPTGLREDLFRRDFTINAMAIGLNKNDYGKLIDFYGGVSDLKKGVIKVLHEKSFLEDPTRLLRAVRFAQRFSFKLDKDTALLMKEALSLEALTFVHHHRLIDELVLILKEAKPAAYIKKLYKLTELSFIDKKMKLEDTDFTFFKRVERTLAFYKKSFKKDKKDKKVEGWLLYLSGIMIRYSLEEIVDFFRKFSLKKGDMIRVFAVKENIGRIKQLNKDIKPHIIYRLLNPLSLESILFFYAYYTQRKIRANIECYLKELIYVHLKVKGQDLKKMEIKPYEIYSQLLQQLLYAKIDKGFTTKAQELEEVKRIFKRLSSKNR
ncbi:MAG: hypothetical protein KKF54_01470 [Candidatus Omnitrophica bacterium]|nr:hypothetical protein [Candidatus Omnitrophota bacterium]